METYQLLRMIDRLRNTVDNLARESWKFCIPETRAYQEKKKKAETESDLLMVEIDRIDGIAEILNKYMAK
jgi:hypothetical protein